MRKVRSGLYRTTVVSSDGSHHMLTVERLTPDVSNEHGWSFAIDSGELSEPYPTKSEARDAARATFFRYYK